MQLKSVIWIGKNIVQHWEEAINEIHNSVHSWGWYSSGNGVTWQQTCLMYGEQVVLGTFICYFCSILFVKNVCLNANVHFSRLYASRLHCSNAPLSCLQTAEMADYESGKCDIYIMLCFKNIFLILCTLHTLIKYYSLISGHYYY